MLRVPIVLVVDDEPDFLCNMADILGDLEYDVDTAEDGDSAMELARRKTYDVVVLDYTMAGKNGLDIFSEIHKQSAAVGVLLASFLAAKIAEDALRAGISVIIAKPINAGELAQVIANSVHDSEASTSN